ncbi:MAG: InlB B-repeat-containing protein, partial [Clostridia bacterium]|nr:InlB B-repeat-containing protein [Clostridia bacterium]
DGTFLATSNFVFGQVVYYDGAEPQKEATQEEVFMFAGWSLDKDNPQLLQDVVLGGAELQFNNNAKSVALYAYFTSEPRKYSCIFYDVENNGIPQEISAFSLNVEYGNEINLDFLVPSKPSTNTHHYIFEGWFENNGYFGGNWGEQVTIFDGKSDLELYAKYTKEDVLYTVTFYYAPSSIGGLEIVENLTQNVTYQTHIDLSLIQGPAKPSTVSNYFVFAGWALGANSDTIETSIVVESNISLYAVYNSFLNTYKITFLIPTENGHDVAFEASEEYGNYLDMSLYNNPQKPSSYSKDFVFENWYATADYQGGIVNHIQVLGDKSYYAKFTEYEKTFEIKLFESDGEELTSFNYQFNGNSISLANVTTSKPKTAQYEFEFAGWYSKNGLENNGDWGEKVESIDFSDENTTSEEDIHINLYPKFVEHIREYVVNFYNNGVKLTNTNMHDEYLVEYGEVATFDRAVQKSSTNKYYYIFEGWAKTQNGEAVSDLTVLQSDNLESDDGVVNFYAQFSEEFRTYYLKLYYEKDSSKIYKTIECIWEEEVNLSSENLTKENTDKHYFEFKGWRYSDTNEKCPSNIVITGDLSLYGDFTQQTIPFKLSQKAINVILIAVGGIVGIAAIVVVFKVVASRGKTGKNSRKAQRTIAKYRAQQIDFEAQRKEIEEIKERTRQKYNKK